MQFTIRIRETDIDVNWDDMPQAAREYIIRYGLKQSLNDVGAGEKDNDSAVAKAEDRLASLYDGDVPSGGGSRLTIIERATRDVMQTTCRKAGFKATESAKMARDPRHALRVVLAAAIAKRDGNACRVDDQRVTAVFDANWAKIETRAKELAATMADTTDIAI